MQAGTKGTTTWNEMVGKEARGTGDFSLGEVKSVGTGFILTEKGIASKDHFYIPKYLVRGYDGHNVWFNLTEPQAKTEFKRDTPPDPRSLDKYKNTSESGKYENEVPILLESR